MTERVISRRRGSYGIDAPFAPALLAFLAALEFAVAAISGKVWPLLAALFLLAFLGFYLYTTLRGKFVVWAELLDQLNLRGDERILDLGCGRGAVLLMAAQHLTTGRAVGVDLWRSVDQSGNSAEATRRNAIAEGVADRVELHTDRGKTKEKLISSKCRLSPASASARNSQPKSLR
jgi:arsenite methyltransferase